MRVVLPAPVAPIKAVSTPGLKIPSTLFSSCSSGRPLKLLSLPAPLALALLLAPLDIP